MAKLPDEVYWRYKKKTPPVDENAHLNGEVKTIKLSTELPHPFKCSKCGYIAISTNKSKEHWFDVH